MDFASGEGASLGCARTGQPRAAAVAAWAVRLLGAGCLVLASWADAAAPGEPGRPLTVAVSSTPHASLLHLAAACGCFAEQGLAVELVPVSHGKAALDKLAAGEVDLAAAAEVPFVVAVLQGQRYAVVATVASVSTEMALVARRDRGISAPANLAGTRVGVTAGTSGEYFLWAWMIRHRLPPGAVTLVDLPPGKLAQALADGKVDAVATWQPVRRDAERLLASNAQTFTAPQSYTTTHVVVGRQDALAGQTPTMRRFVRALLQAEDFLRRERQRAIEMVASRLRVPPAELGPLWSDLALRVDQRQSQLITWEDQARWAMTRGYATTRPVPNLLPNLYLEALDAEAPARVTVVH